MLKTAREAVREGPAPRDSVRAAATALSNSHAVAQQRRFAGDPRRALRASGPNHLRSGESSAWPLGRSSDSRTRGAPPRLEGGAAQAAGRSRSTAQVRGPCGAGGAPPRFVPAHRAEHRPGWQAEHHHPGWSAAGRTPEHRPGWSTAGRTAGAPPRLEHHRRSTTATRSCPRCSSALARSLGPAEALRAHAPARLVQLRNCSVDRSIPSA